MEGPGEEEEEEGLTWRWRASHSGSQEWLAYACLLVAPQKPCMPLCQGFLRKFLSDPWMMQCGCMGLSSWLARVALIYHARLPSSLFVKEFPHSLWSLLIRFGDVSWISGFEFVSSIHSFCKRLPLHMFNAVLGSFWRAYLDFHQTGEEGMQYEIRNYNPRMHSSLVFPFIYNKIVEKYQDQHLLQLEKLGCA